MKILSGGVVAILLAAGIAGALGAPINDKCPVKVGTAAKPNITATYKGKPVAFCCNNCKAMFEKDPDKYAANLGPQARTALNSVADAVKAAKGSKPVLVLFMDTTAKTKLWTEQLGETQLDDLFDKIAYAAVLFDKDGADEKLHGVTAAPSLVLVDPSKTDAKGKKIASPAGVRKEVEAAIKAAK